MADPERSTELLWEAKSRRGLNLDRIVRTAVELADTEGLAAVSMRRLAERLGFTTMALYRHVPGKAELVALMRDEVHGEPAADGGTGTDTGTGRSTGWRGALAAWARDGLELHRRHPWLVETDGGRTVPGPRTVARFDRALDIVAGSGLPPAQVVASVNLVGGFIDSTARQAAAAALAERRTGVTDEQWWGERDSLFARLERYPALTRLYRDGAFDASLDPFEFGLQRVLDGVESLVRDVTRDEMECAVCGASVGSAQQGRPRDYCSRACQQRAYRIRRRRRR